MWVTRSGWTLRLPALLLGAVLALAAGGCESKSKAEKAAAPAPVTLAPVQLKDVPREVSAFGSVEASSTVDVRAQVPGLITQVHFKEGDFVKTGDLLFTIDTRPYSASLAAAQAELLRNQALAEQARVEAERAARLREDGVASDQEVQKAEADARSTAANVKLGQAQMQSARLNVGFTQIKSPIDGRTGSLLVHAGNIVKATDAQPLVIIRRLAPVYVRFAIPQEYLSVVRDKLGHEPLTARITPRLQGAQPLEAPVTFLENTVDLSTGTIALKATYPNTHEELWPGGSVDVKLQLGLDKAAVVVPEAALQRSQSGSSVFVVGKDERASLRSVQVERVTDTWALIKSGLQPGEQVVTEGQLRLRTGMQVAPKPASKASQVVPADQQKPEGL